MSQDNMNIYKTARLGAGLSQEAAAEVLDVSVESIRAYETGQRVPPNQTVVLMADVYGAPGLRLEHGRETDELGLIPREAAPRPLEQIALRMHGGLRRLRDREPRLMEIAEDGKVDPDEWEDFAQIRAAVGSFVAMCLELECCEGAKKERPELAGSKRSCSVEIHKNHRKTIIPEIPRNATKICAGEGVTSL